MLFYFILLHALIIILYNSVDRIPNKYNILIPSFPHIYSKSITKESLKLFLQMFPFVNLNEACEANFQVPIAANWKGVYLQNTSKHHSYRLKIW